MSECPHGVIYREDEPLLCPECDPSIAEMIATGHRVGEALAATLDACHASAWAAPAWIRDGEPLRPVDLIVTDPPWEERPSSIFGADRAVRRALAIAAREAWEAAEQPAPGADWRDLDPNDDEVIIAWALERGLL